LTLSIGFSPCPNDTFIFDALIHQKIDTEGLHFDPVLEDVQTLNQWAIEGKLDITKLSYGVLPLAMTNYQLLNSGSALGKGVGPLLISNGRNTSDDLAGEAIAIPGENTTAHLLFTLKYPNAKNKIFLRYDAIEEFVLQGKGLGVIIHENRFTYAEKGLHKVVDLGDYWEQQTKVPIPLGGIVIKTGLSPDVKQKVDRLIRKSVEYSFSKYPQLDDYVKEHAQEMSEDVMRKHIDLYVNNYSIDIGQEGKTAVLKLMEVYGGLKGSSMNFDQLFVSGH
jgi:1,4-dihydroxy-6-naphthoate synthase